MFHIIITVRDPLFLIIERFTFVLYDIFKIALFQSMPVSCRVKNKLILLTLIPGKPGNVRYESCSVFPVI